jgi:hypothetical protein
MASVDNSLLGSRQRPMGFLDDDDDNVVRDATIEEVSQAVFSASPLGDYIGRPTKAV